MFNWSSFRHLAATTWTKAVKIYFGVKNRAPKNSLKATDRQFEKPGLAKISGCSRNFVSSATFSRVKGFWWHAFVAIAKVRSLILINKTVIEVIALQQPPKQVSNWVEEARLFTKSLHLPYQLPSQDLNRSISSGNDCSTTKPGTCMK